MKICENLQEKLKRLEKKSNSVIKNKTFCKWIKEDLDIIKVYCKKEECPTKQCKEIERLYKKIYKI